MVCHRDMLVPLVLDLCGQQLFVWADLGKPTRARDVGLGACASGRDRELLHVQALVRQAGVVGHSDADASHGDFHVPPLRVHGTRRACRLPRAHHAEPGGESAWHRLGTLGCVHRGHRFEPGGAHLERQVEGLEARPHAIRRHPEILYHDGPSALLEPCVERLSGPRRRLYDVVPREVWWEASVTSGQLTDAVAALSGVHRRGILPPQLLDHQDVQHRHIRGLGAALHHLRFLLERPVPQRAELPCTWRAVADDSCHNDLGGLPLPDGTLQSQEREECPRNQEENRECRWLDEFVALDVVASAKAHAPGRGCRRHW
mmetsp:Transcript_47958/g.133693  ORF Transcript_47958/g.133693 Transcript_47958/m.133693 type:complete len:316 (-) Transcript_47958:1348-2295(-)